MASKKSGFETFATPFDMVAIIRADTNFIAHFRSQPRAVGRQRFFIALYSMLSSLLLLTACTEHPNELEQRGLAATNPAYSGTLPTDTSWTDFGPLLEAGEVGEWDHYLWGAFAAGILKKDDTYFLYYQGASSYRYADDETVCGRAIGVATSRDGINFEKYEGNPVITWAPNDECEEGAVSLALATDKNGDILAFYGANTARNSTSVNADARLARSSDGLHFEDLGIVLDHDDKAIWGSGDELFPIVAAYAAGKWLLYYLPNGKGISRRLGVAWGNSPFELTHSSAVQEHTQGAVAMWGTGSYVQIKPNVNALFLFENPEDLLQAWSISPDSPQFLENQLASYTLEKAIHASVLLDKSLRTWFLYYHVGNQYRIKVAPDGELDESGPTPPPEVKGNRVSSTRVELSWAQALDPETGVAAYKIYRNGVLIRSVTGTRFADAVFEHTSPSYEISSVNLHGVEGPHSMPVLVSAYASNMADRSDP